MDKDECLKISDFGLSTFRDQSGDRCRTQCGTPNYVAPEVFSSGSGSYSGGPADVWSSGVVLFVLASGDLPFDEDTPEQVLLRVVANDWVMPEYWSESLKNLMFHLLDPDPERRFTLEQIRMHPWYTQDVTHPISGSLELPAITPTSAVVAAAAHASTSPAAPTEQFAPDEFDPCFPGDNTNQPVLRSTDALVVHPDVGASDGQWPVVPPVSSTPLPAGHGPPEPTLRSGAIPPLPTGRPRSRGNDADLDRFQSAEYLGAGASGVPPSAAPESAIDEEGSDMGEPLEMVLASTHMVDHMARRQLPPKRFGAAPTAVSHAPIAVRAAMPPAAPAAKASVAALRASSAWQDAEDSGVGVAPSVPAALPMFPASGVVGAAGAIGVASAVALDTVGPTDASAVGGWPSKDLDDTSSSGGDQFDDAPADVVAGAGDAAWGTLGADPPPWTLPPPRDSPLAQAHIAGPTAAAFPVAAPAHVLPHTTGRVLAPAAAPAPMHLPAPLTIPSFEVAPAPGTVGPSMGVDTIGASVAPVPAAVASASVPPVAQSLALPLVDLTAVVSCNACVGCVQGSACDVPEDVGAGRFNRALNSQWQQLVDSCLVDSASRQPAVMAPFSGGASPARPNSLAMEELRASPAPDRSPSLPVSPSLVGAPPGHAADPGIDPQSTVSRHGRGSGAGSVRSRRSSVTIGEPSKHRRSSRHNKSSETGARRHGRLSMDSMRGTQLQRSGRGSAPVTNAVNVSRDVQSDGDGDGEAHGADRADHPSLAGSRSSSRACRLQSGASSVGRRDVMSPMTSGGIGGSQLSLTRDHVILKHTGKAWQDIDTRSKDEPRRPPSVSRTPKLSELFPSALPDDGELIVFAGCDFGPSLGKPGSPVPIGDVDKSTGQPWKPSTGHGASTGSDDVRLSSTGHARFSHSKEPVGALQENAGRSPSSVQHSKSSRRRRSHYPPSGDAKPTSHSPHDRRSSRADRHASRSGSRRSPRAGEQGLESSRAGRHAASSAGVSRRSSRRGSPDAVDRRDRSASRSRARSRRRSSRRGSPDRSSSCSRRDHRRRRSSRRESPLPHRREREPSSSRSKRESHRPHRRCVSHSSSRRLERDDLDDAGSRVDPKPVLLGSLGVAPVPVAPTQAAVTSPRVAAPSLAVSNEALTFTSGSTGPTAEVEMARMGGLRGVTSRLLAKSPLQLSPSHSHRYTELTSLIPPRGVAERLVRVLRGVPGVNSIQAVKISDDVFRLDVKSAVAAPHRPDKESVLSVTVSIQRRELAGLTVASFRLATGRRDRKAYTAWCLSVISSYAQVTEAEVTAEVEAEGSTSPAAA